MSSDSTPRSTARKLARESLARGDALGWFETLYTTASGDEAAIPWADLEPNPNLLAWLGRQPAPSAGSRAIVIGCGLGDDAEELAQRGFQVVAFDISATAIAWCRKRYPDSLVDYQVADLLSPPDAWHAAFDFVLETYTLQVLPEELHETAIEAIASLAAPGGTMLCISRGRDPEDKLAEIPWPIARSGLDPFQRVGLDEVRFEDYVDDEDPPVRRFRVEYRKPLHQGNQGD